MISLRSETPVTWIATPHMSETTCRKAMSVHVSGLEIILHQFSTDTLPSNEQLGQWSMASMTSWPRSMGMPYSSVREVTFR